MIMHSLTLIYFKLLNAGWIPQILTHSMQSIYSFFLLISSYRFVILVWPDGCSVQCLSCTGRWSRECRSLWYEPSLILVCILPHHLLPWGTSHFNLWDLTILSIGTVGCRKPSGGKLRNLLVGTCFTAQPMFWRVVKTPQRPQRT